MTGEDLYQMLGLDKSASQADIKKAYYKLALQWHPDRNPAPEATAKFQALQRIYDVLSDPQKRQVYNRTGSLQDCEDMVQSENYQELYAAFREALKVKEDDIDSFAVTYRGSSEERADLLRLYSQFGGDMSRVFDWLMLSRPDLDSHRFRDTIEAAIAAGEVKRLKAYKRWATQVAATPPPSTDPLAPPPKKQKGDGKGSKAGGSDELALVAAIRNKSTAFGNVMAALEAKYANGGSSSKGKKKQKKHKEQPAAAAAAGGSSSGSKRKRGSKAAAAAAAGSSDEGGSDVDSEADQGPEPTEEEFEAARARLEQRAANGKGEGKAAGTTGGSSSRAGKAGKAAAGGKKQKKQRA